VGREDPEARAVGLVIGDGITRPDIPLLCSRVGRLLDAAHPDTVICDVSALADPDGVTIDVLARLALTSRRRGLEFRLHGASAALEALLSFVGLRAAVPLCAELHPRSLEARGKTEQRKEHVGVEEVRDPSDSVP
jgi:hypothetical protein